MPQQATRNKKPTANQVTDAIWADDTNEIIRLVRAGAPLNELDDNGYPPLIIALLEEKNKDAARLLIDNNADVNLKSKDGMTPLYAAVNKRNKELVALLIDKGARIDEPSLNGQTPLTWAVQIGSKELVRLLLEKGADPDAADDKGLTPRDWAASPEHEGMEGIIDETLESIRAAAAAKETAAQAEQVAAIRDLAAGRVYRLKQNAGSRLNIRPKF
jgi:ankyrin repeat protein